MEAAPTPEDIERLLAFLPRLYADGFEPYVKSRVDDPREFGMRLLAGPDYSKVVGEFIDEASRDCWTDSAYDPMEAMRMLENQTAVASVDLAQIRTMLTVIVRGERFCSGHWAAMIDEGHVRRVLERLAEIAEG